MKKVICIIVCCIGFASALFGVGEETVTTNNGFVVTTQLKGNTKNTTPIVLGVTVDQDGYLNQTNLATKAELANEVSAQSQTNANLLAKFDNYTTTTSLTSNFLKKTDATATYAARLSKTSLEALLIQDEFTEVDITNTVNSLIRLIMATAKEEE